MSASFSAILRIRLADEAWTFGRVATAIGEQGALLGAIDLVRIERAHKVRDVTILAEDEDHIKRVAGAVPSTCWTPRCGAARASARARWSSRSGGPSANRCRRFSRAGPLAGCRSKGSPISLLRSQISESA